MRRPTQGRASFAMGVGFGALSRWKWTCCAAHETRSARIRCVPPARRRSGWEWWATRAAVSVPGLSQRPSALLRSGGAIGRVGVSPPLCAACSASGPPLRARGPWMYPPATIHDACHCLGRRPGPGVLFNGSCRRLPLPGPRRGRRSRRRHFRGGVGHRVQELLDCPRRISRPPCATRPRHRAGRGTPRNPSAESPL